MTHAEKCPVCGGSGRLDVQICHGCEGWGWVTVGEPETPTPPPVVWPTPPPVVWPSRGPYRPPCRKTGDQPDWTLPRTTGDPVPYRGDNWISGTGSASPPQGIITPVPGSS